LQIAGVVYIPGLLLTAICFPDQKKLPVENKYPHVTLMTGGTWTPKMSNTALEAAISQSEEVSNWYKALKAGKEPKDKVAYFSKLSVSTGPP
jgi:hypothetical protein